MTPARKETVEMLERTIDAYGLNAVVTMLADICVEKAEHIAVTWQDVPTAKVWSRAADLLDEVGRKIVV